jgi:TonB-dependent SusC/RagA subfamily outer membrane receptor
MYKKLLRIMRLTTIILVTAILQVSASTYGQKITLSERNATLVEVFDQISVQSGYDFLVSASILKDSKPVRIDVKGMELSDVLEKLFEGRQLKFSIEDKSVVVSKKMPSFLDKAKSVILNLVQDQDVRGKIVGEQSQVLVGATVKVKGTSRITKSNEKGEFYLANVDEDAVLEISYIGFKALEIPVKGAVMPLEIKLNVATGELEEVNIASTGYQKIKPNEINGSVVLIDNKKLNQQVGANILQRLEGITNGLTFTIGKANPNPQNKTNITIRGLSTINGPLDPLIVLDGFIYERDIENINPNIVDNITILKDAAAASIWGARAGNGVIVITTKTGRFNEKLKVDFSANMIVKDKPNLYDLPQMSSADIIDVEQFLFDKGFFNNRINQKFTSLTPAVEVFLKRRDKLISKEDSAARINALKMINTRDQYEQYVYKKAVFQQYGLNIRGGSNNNAFSLSAGYDQSNNELHGRSKKLNLRMENNYRPIKNLNINIGAYYTNSRINSGIPGYGGIQLANRNVPYFRLADENGVPLSVPTQYRDSYIDTAGAGKLLNWKFYPLEDYNHNTSISNAEELYATTGLEYRITSYLDIDLKYQYQDQTTDVIGLRDQQSYATRDYINQFSQLNRTTGIVKYIVPLGAIRNFSESKVHSNTLSGDSGNSVQSFSDQSVHFNFSRQQP